MSISLKLLIRYSIFNHCNKCHPKTLTDAVSYSSQKTIVSCDTIKLQYSHCKTTKFHIQDQQPLSLSGESRKKLEKKLLLRCKRLVQRTQTCSFFWVVLFTLMRWSFYPFFQFSRSVMSYSLQPHGLQHARLPCPSPTPRAYSNSCPLNQWCHPTISSSVVPFSCLQSFLAFLVSQSFISGGQSIGASTSASVLPMSTQDWSPLGWTSWISLLSNGFSRVFSNTTVQKHQFFVAQLSSQYNSHIHIWPVEKP